ncbi:unnamed protein product [Echinostoma caproni]|uniref:Uncharacterized protein n=1 Tax=Echinostoma caproni TaxID=27848 RepID=A0A183BA79_9TREM|nr:unnamed protein product [Echinostoma caproni]
MLKTPKSEDATAQTMDTDGTQLANVLRSNSKYSINTTARACEVLCENCADWPAEHGKMIRPSELEKLLEQLIKGSRSNNVRRHLLMNPPSDLEMAVKRAEDMEKLEAGTVAP